MVSLNILLFCFVVKSTLGSDLLCINRGGTCQDDSISCPGGYVSNHCSGAANRRCCLPSTSSGHCQDDSMTCHVGIYVSGLCSGASNRRCCTQVKDTGSCNNVKIISRDSWGARDPKTISQEHLPVDLFFIHHTEGPSCTDTATCISIMKGIQNFHMDDRDWSDIGYSFLVGEDGNVYEGRGWHRVGAHTQGYNSRSLAVSVMGNYMNHLPNEKALAAVKALIQCGVDNGYISHHYRLYGHRDAGSTNCPGTTLYNLIRTWPHYSTISLH
ncbi:hypothetical protein KUTeg_005143 [Tegillarca granosa]|uniref:Uncharacterized protein n=1 Tax=Tegillarca granosa TaxID=220873 RepID=A0ABQ9FIY9_TEGGR|nr:hypothetical protein KUTeg_005143 [Tegillarca granosa]